MNLVRKLKLLMVWSLIFSSLSGFGVNVDAAGSSVVINEVAWAGTIDNSNDEWIELYNTSNKEVDLSGWKIIDDGTTTYTINEGKIAPYGYFVIVDSDKVFSNLQPNAIIPLSLANAGDSLELKDSNNLSIDMVDTAAKWFAGGGDNKSTMERVNPALSGSDPNNWVSSTTSNGTKSRNGNLISGTPGSVNGSYGGDGIRVEMAYSSTIQPNDILTIPVTISDAVDLYAYAIEMSYDSDSLEFIDIEEGNFLNAGGVETAFLGSLENGLAGKLVIGNARITNPISGVDGSGTLLRVTFRVKDTISGATEITFSGSSSLSDVNGETPAIFNGIVLGFGSGVSPELGDFVGQEGEDRYQISLSWSGNADRYVVSKKNVFGNYETVYDGNATVYVDNNSIVPGIEYSYRVTAFLEGVSTSLEISAMDSRGIKGDGDRNDKVNGKDIELIARSYGSEFGDEEYNILLDFNFDGVINGQDLVIIGSNFGKTI